jgi:hypothetical protein
LITYFANQLLFSEPPTEPPTDFVQQQSEFAMHACLCECLSLLSVSVSVCACVLRPGGRFERGFNCPEIVIIYFVSLFVCVFVCLFCNKLYYSCVVVHVDLCLRLCLCVRVCGVTLAGAGVPARVSRTGAWYMLAEMRVDAGAVVEVLPLRSTCRTRPTLPLHSPHTLTSTTPSLTLLKHPR